MISAGAGLSTAEDTERAAREAAQTALEQAGIERADWALLFATAAHRFAYRDLVRSVAEELETDCLVGCTGAGVLTHEGEVEGSAGVCVLAVASDSIRAIPFLFRDEGDGGLTSGYELAATLAGSEPERDLLVLLPDPYHIQPERLLRAIDSKLGPVPAVGAAAADDGTAGATYQFCGEEISSASVAGIRLHGRFRHTIGVTQGCRPIGEPLILTRVLGNIAVELDGRPALSVLAEQLPCHLLEDVQRLLNNVFVALLPDPSDREIHSGEYLVRNFTSFDPAQGSFGVATQLVEGQTLMFVVREGATAREDLKRMLESIRARQVGGSYRFGFYFNCAGRGRSLYHIPGIDTAFLGAALGQVPIAGFFGNAELAPMRGVNRLFTYTGVLALFSEQEGG